MHRNVLKPKREVRRFGAAPILLHQSFPVDSLSMSLSDKNKPKLIIICKLSFALLLRIVPDHRRRLMKNYKEQ